MRAINEVPDISEALIEEAGGGEPVASLPARTSDARSETVSAARGWFSVFVAAVCLILVVCGGTWSVVQARRAAAAFELAHADDIQDDTVPRYAKVRVSGYDGEGGPVPVGTTCDVVEALRQVRNVGAASFYSGRLDCGSEVELVGVSVVLVQAAPTTAWTVGSRVRLVNIEAPEELVARRPELLGRACTLQTAPTSADATGSVWSFAANCETAQGVVSLELQRAIIDAPIDPRPDRDALLQPPFRVARFAFPTPELAYTFDVALTELTASQAALRGDREQPLLLSWPETVALANALSAAQGLDQCYEAAPMTKTASSGPVATVDWPRGVFCQGWRVPSVAEFTWLASGLDGVAAWTVSEGHGVTHRVAILPPDAHGLHDVHGNRAEWVWSATAPSSSSMPVDARGGSVEDDSPVTILPRAAVRLVRTSLPISEDTCTIADPFPNYGGIRAGQTAYVRETGVAVLVVSLDGKGPDGCGQATVQESGEPPRSASALSLSALPVDVAPDVDLAGGAEDVPQDGPSSRADNATEDYDRMSPEERCSGFSDCSIAVRAVAKLCQARIEKWTTELLTGRRWQVRYRASLLGGRSRVQVESAGEAEPAFERCLTDALTDVPWRPSTLVTVSITL